MKRKIGFYLLGYKGYECLRHYLNNHDSDTIDFIFIGRDNGVENDYYHEISNLCRTYSLRVLEKNDVARISIKPDMIRVSIGWRWMIPQSERLVIFHDSLLPKYRGFAPIVNALIDGEDYVGVSALWATDDYDVGDIISQRKLAVCYPVKVLDVIKSIVPLYVELLLDISHKFFAGIEMEIQKQDSKYATYSLWRDAQDYEVCWHRDSGYIKRMVDAVGPPYKGAISSLNGRKVRINDVEVVEDVVISDRKHHVGKVIKIDCKSPVVVCGEGLIKITKFVDVESGKTPVYNFRARFGV